MKKKLPLFQMTMHDKPSWVLFDKTGHQVIDCVAYYTVHKGWWSMEIGNKDKVPVAYFMRHLPKHCTAQKLSQNRYINMYLGYLMSTYLMGWKVSVQVNMQQLIKPYCILDVILLLFAKCYICELLVIWGPDIVQREWDRVSSPRRS